MSRKRNISRRRFLGEASCAAIGSTAFLSSMLNLGAINTLAARPHIVENTGNYKAMVCILFNRYYRIFSLSKRAGRFSFRARRFTLGNTKQYYGANFWYS